jgi:serine/threonine protein kinase
MLYGLYKEKGGIYIVMEYLSLNDLHSFLQSGRVFKEIDFLSMLIHTARGLNYLHTKNYLHNDIAARNVLVGFHPSPTTSEGSAYIYKLGDFGHSTPFENPNPKQFAVRYERFTTSFF